MWIYSAYERTFTHFSAVEYPLLSRVSAQEIKGATKMDAK
jgi:hypothetical protein